MRGYSASSPLERGSTDGRTEGESDAVGVIEGVDVWLTCVGDAVSETGVGVLLGVTDGVGLAVREELADGGGA